MLAMLANLSPEELGAVLGAVSAFCTMVGAIIPLVIHLIPEKSKQDADFLELLFDDLSKLISDITSESKEPAAMLREYFGVKKHWEIIDKALNLNYMRLPKKLKEEYHNLKNEWDDDVLPMADKTLKANLARKDSTLAVDLDLQILQNSYGQEGAFRFEAERLKRTLIHFERDIALFKEKLTAEHEKAPSAH